MTRLRVDFFPEAVAEAADARLWYSEIAPALGESFADELDLALERIATAPKRWPLHLLGTRSVALRRFPYQVVYRVLEDIVQIVAVQHFKRRPGYWKARIE